MHHSNSQPQRSIELWPSTRLRQLLVTSAAETLILEDGADGALVVPLTAAIASKITGSGRQIQPTRPAPRVGLLDGNVVDNSLDHWGPIEIASKSGVLQAASRQGEKVVPIAGGVVS